LKNCAKGCILVLKKAQLMEEREMESLKEEAISAISKMPDSADIDEIMYRLYVIDKVRKGREAVLQGDVVTAEELKREMESW
jgi:isopentenyl phosphate kinase